MTEETCGIFLVCKDTHEILVCHATNSRWKTWGIPKGLKDPGESSLTAAIRELNEETSLNIKDYLNNVDTDLHYLGQYKYKNANKILTAYWAFVDNKIPISKMQCQSMVTKDDDPEFESFPEVDKYSWLTLEKAATALYFVQREALAALKAAIVK